MFLSFTARYLINVESLNGVGSVGNISRHRSAPLVVKVDNGYAVKYFPVVSGESIAHGYQVLLAEIGKEKKLPIGKRSINGELLKFTDDYLLEEEGIEPPKVPKADKGKKAKKEKAAKIAKIEMRRLEVEIMLKDYVSDVGGFLYAGDIPVKRTSVFQVSYMVPAYGVSAEVASLEAQLHVRYSSTFKLSEQSEEQSERKKNEESEEEEEERGRAYQLPYSVDVGSALYSVTFNIDLDHIAVPSNAGVNEDEIKDDSELEGMLKNLKDNEAKLARQKADRQEVALLAFARLFENLEFGAKKSRFFPQATLEEAVITLTDKPFVVTPSVVNNYLTSTEKRLTKMTSLGLVSPMVLGVIGVKNPPSAFQEYSSIAEAVDAVIKAIKEGKKNDSKKNEHGDQAS